MATENDARDGKRFFIILLPDNRRKQEVPFDPFM